MEADGEGSRLGWVGRHTGSWLRLPWWVEYKEEASALEVAGKKKILVLVTPLLLLREKNIKIGGRYQASAKEA